MREWPRARLDWLVTEERRTVDPRSLKTGEVFHYSIPVLDEVGNGQVEPADEIGSGKLLLEGGEVLVSKLNPRLPRVVQAERHDVPTLASTEFIALRPGPTVDRRFLCYWLRSEHVRQFLDGATLSVTRSQQRVRPDVLTKRRVSFPSRRQQCMIADFLDAETARIDALIAKKEKLLSVVDEWEQASMLLQVGDWQKTNTVSLRNLGTTVVTGPFGTQLVASEYKSGGVPVVNPVHIWRGGIAPEEHVTVSEEVANRLNRHRVLPGDLILGRKGDVGRAALVEPHHSGWICGSDSIAVRPSPALLLGEFLAGLLRIDYYRQQLAARSTGAMVASVNEPTLLSFQVPAVSTDAQTEVVRRLHKVHQRRDEVVSRLSRQIALLQERRQALITAAVTGQLDIPGLAA